MKIVAAKVIVTCPGRNFVTLKIETDQGVYGIGDATLNGRELSVVSYLEDHVVPCLIGMDPRRTEDIWQYLYRGAYWRRGPVTMRAIAAVDVALWDIKAKMAGMPLYQLLGGRSRDSVMVYGHANGSTIADTVEAVGRYIDMGYKAIRAQTGVPGIKDAYGVGRGDLYYEPADASLPSVTGWDTRKALNYVPKLFEELRKTYGFDHHLLHDGHHRYTPQEAANLGKMLEPFQLFWLEDCTPAENQEAFKLVRQHTTTPLAVGDRVYWQPVAPCQRCYACTVLGDVSIAKLFMAALIPGLLAAAFYIVAIAVMVRLRPDLGPRAEAPSPAERRDAFLNVIPVLLIAAIVVGGIYGGVFTPTEAASVGAFVMLAIGVVRRTLGLAEIRQAILQTAETSAMIFAILLGAEVFNAFLALTQVPAAAAAMIASSGWGAYPVLIGLLAFYIVLGGVMDELAMILLTLPVFFPIVTALDFGMPPDDVAIWFGILVLIVVGIGMTCPPIGINVFVVASLARDTPVTRIYRGVLPFVLSDVIRLGLVVAFPMIALYLVKLLD